MVPQGSKIQSIISIAGHQVIRNLSEPSEFTLMHLETYADYLRQLESRAVRALLKTGGPRTKKLHGRYVQVYGPYQVMLYVDGISIYTRTYVTTDSDQIGQIYLGEEELKVRRIGHDAMMEQDAVHIGYEVRDLWMSFLVVKNLDDSDQFILGRDFVRKFDVMIDLNNGNPDRKYVKKPINRIITDENKVPIL